jgi:3-hydroxyacyl-CoA dehydrogenase
MTDKIAIVGAGLIGRAWAIVFARAGRQVALYDSDPLVLPVALEKIGVNLADLAESGLIADPAETIQRIEPVKSLEAALHGALYIQENGPENLAIKQALFRELDRLAGPAAVLASSSSALRASLFTEDLPGRARCLVAHPVNPPYLVPLVELSPAPWTSRETVARTRALMEAVGQVPVELRREIPGFLLNRLQGALLGEAFRLVEQGYCAMEDIDKTVKDGLGLRWSFMGPFETIDLNAPGGIADYIRRYGSAYHEMAQSAGAPETWSSALTARLEAERRAVLPVERLAERAGWRDRRLMALLVHKRKAGKETGE